MSIRLPVRPNAEPPAVPDVSFSIDEVVVLLGLLGLVVAPPDVHPLWLRTTERVKGRLGASLDRHFGGPATGTESLDERNSLRLARRLQVSLEGVASIVTDLEDRTELQDRPLLLLAVSERAAWALSGRIGELSA
jgi:hypothetical protein